MTDPRMLRRILQAERDCLRNGTLADLPALSRQKEDALQAIRGAGAKDLPALRALLAEAAANQQLLDAAQKGVRAALTRIEAIRAVGRGLTAYNAQGETVRHHQPEPGMERRA